MQGPLPFVSGYQIRQRLGGGSTCDVFAAIDEEFGKPVAIKFLKREAEAELFNTKLFIREAHIGSSLNHQHLIQYISTDVHRAGMRHIVMEFIPGITLRQAIQKRLLPVHLTIRFANQIAAALAHMHQQNVIHADIKPENVHLTSHHQVKLMDFGFSHHPRQNAQIVDGEFVLGTANYIAPEMCRQPAVDDLPGDIFAFGVMLFEMLVGELPYPEGSTEKTMLRHRDDQPASMRHIVGAWPRELAHLVDRMLERDPKRRPTMAEVHDRFVLLSHTLNGQAA